MGAASSPPFPTAPPCAMGCLPNDLGKRNTEIGRQHYLVGLSLGWPPLPLIFAGALALPGCLEASVRNRVSASREKNRRMRSGRDKSPLFYLPHEYVTFSPRFLNLKMRIKA